MAAFSAEEQAAPESAASNLGQQQMAWEINDIYSQTTTN